MKRNVFVVFIAILLSSLISIAMIYANKLMEDRAFPSAVSNIAKEASLEIFQEKLQNEHLSDAERDQAVSYQRTIGIRLTIIPLSEKNIPQENEATVLDPVFSQGYLYDKYVILAPKQLFDLPRSLEDGRSYETRIAVVMFPDARMDNPNLQERLEKIIWSGADRGLPILIFERTNPILLVPATNLSATPLSAIAEHNKIYQFNAIGENPRLLIPSEGSVVFVNQGNGFFIFQGNMDFDSPEGAFLFAKDKNGLQVIGIVVKKIGSLNGVAFPMEQLLTLSGLK